jgi:hypothetical protein
MRQLFLTSIVTTLLVLPTGPTMLAQTGAQVATQPPSDLVLTGAGGVILQSFDVDELVGDAPYSAAGTTEIVQPLTDGNRIVRQTSASIARDSRGRVRREQTLAAVGAVIMAGDEHTVTISDPASGTSYVLDPQRRIAIRHRTRQVPTGTTPPDNGIATLRMGKPIAGTEQNNGPFFRTFREQGSETLPPRGPLAAPATKTESLGQRDIEGVTAEGTRTTITIPAGAIGNERAIESVYERWFSRDLRIVVLSHNRDPRFGETTYRLTHINREEPASWLFDVPSDYRIVDEPLPR